MKRLALAVLCLSVVLTFCACVPNQQGETPPVSTQLPQPTSPIETPPAEPPQSSSPIKPLPSGQTGETEAPSPEPTAAPTSEPVTIITPGTRQLVAMDSKSGVYLYVEEDGMLFLKHKEKGGPVDLGSGLVNYFDPPEEWNATGQLAISVYGGNDFNGRIRVEIIIDDENSAILSGAVFWNETHQYWSSDSTPNDDPPKPYLSVSPVAQNEDGTMHTRFDLICNGTRITYDGQAIIDGEESHAIYTDSANLFGDEALELIVVHTTSCNEGMHQREVHVFDGTTMKELDCSGLVEDLLSSFSFTREDGTYYISAENFSAAIYSRNIPYDEAQLLEQITIGHEVDFRIENDVLYAVFPCCIAEDCSCYGEIWISLTRSFQRLVPAEYQLRGVGKYTQRSLQTIEIQGSTYQPDNVFGTPVQIKEPVVFQITLPGQFRDVSGDLCAYNDEGKPVTLGDGFVLIRVDEEFVLDETAIQKLQVATSGGVYVDNAADGMIVIPYKTSAGYEAMYYAPESNPDYINFAYIRIAPEYVLHVFLSKPELVPICYEILDSIVVVDSGSLMFGTKDLASVIKELVGKRQVIPYDYLRYMNEDQRALAEQYNEETRWKKSCSINTALWFMSWLSDEDDYNGFSLWDDEHCQLLGRLSETLLYRNYAELIQADDELAQLLSLKDDAYEKLDQLMLELYPHHYGPDAIESYLILTHNFLASLQTPIELPSSDIYGKLTELVLDRRVVPDVYLDELDAEMAALLRTYNEQTVYLKQALAGTAEQLLEFRPTDGKPWFEEQFIQRLSVQLLYRNFSSLTVSDTVTGLLNCVYGGGSGNIWVVRLHDDSVPGDEKDELKQANLRYLDLVDEILDSIKLADSGTLAYCAKAPVTVVRGFVENRQVIPYDYLRYLNQEQRAMAEAYNEQTKTVALHGTYAAMNTAQDVFDADLDYHSSYHQDDSFYQLISAASPLILYRNYAEVIDTKSAVFSPMDRKVNSYGKLNYEIEQHRAGIDSYETFTMEEYFTLTEQLLSSLGQSQLLVLTGIHAEIADCVLNREIISDAVLEQIGQEYSELLRQYNEQTLLLKEAYTKKFRGWFDYFHDVEGEICDYSTDPFHNRFLERLSYIVLYENYSQLSHSDPVVSIIAAFEGGGSASLWASMYHEDWYVGEELAKQVQDYFCLVEDILNRFDDL